MFENLIIGSRFSGLPKTEGQVDGVRDRLLEALTYTTADKTWAITVPAGFVTDYASIPRVLHVLIPPRGPYNRAAIIHDMLYQLAPKDPRNGLACTRATADAVMREACHNLGVSLLLRSVIWAGLRAGGWAVWARYRDIQEGQA